MRALLVAVLTWCAVAHAHGYPSKAVRIVVPYPPGGGTDLVARTVAEKLAERLHQPFVVENRPGASEIIGTDAVVQAPADGYTVLLMSNTLAINVALQQATPYNAERDLLPVTRLVNVPFALLVHPSVPAHSVSELVALAKREPGKLNGAHIGIATPHHLTLQWFNWVSGAKITPVPYKGAGPALTALVAGEVQLMFAGMGGATSYIKAGRLRALAVTSAHRVPSAPQLPTIAESGYPDLDMTAWYGVMVRTGTPSDAVKVLHSALANALALPDVMQRFAGVGMEATSDTPEEFGRLVQKEIANWRKVVHATGVTIDAR